MVTYWERAELLALVCDVYCDVVTFLLVSCVRCGAQLIVSNPDLCPLSCLVTFKAAALRGN